MAYSYTDYVADGVNKVYAIPFKYIEKANITVYINDESTNAYSFVGDYTIQLNALPTAGTKIRIARNTRIDDRVVDYQDGSVLTEKTLDLDSQQAFFLSQEAYDKATSGLLQLSDGNFDTRFKRIINLADPINPQDAVNKQYFETHLPQATDLTQIRNDITNLYDVKQQNLVSGVNIKTVNDKTILGNGNLVIESNYTPFDKEWTMLISNGFDYSGVGFNMSKYGPSTGTITHIPAPGDHYDAANPVKNFSRFKLSTTAINQFISVSSRHAMAAVNGANDVIAQDHKFICRFGFDSKPDNNYKLSLGAGGLQLDNTSSEPDYDGILLIKKSTSSNLFFFLGDGGGAYKYTFDTGHTPIQGHIYEFTYICTKNSNNVYFKLENRTNGFVVEKVLTGQIPNYLNFRASMQSYATTKTTEFSVLRVYVENNISF